MKHALHLMMKIGMLLVLCLAAGVSALAGDTVFNIEPTKEHPRNSEGSFVTLKDGHILFCYSQFYGGTADGASARIVGIESTDHGTTWSEPRVIVENDAGDNVMSVS